MGLFDLFIRYFANTIQHPALWYHGHLCAAVSVVGVAK